MRRLAWIGRFRGYSGFAQATQRYVQALLPFFDNLIIQPLEVLEESDPWNLMVKPLTETDFRVINHLPTTDPEGDAYLSVYEYDHIPQEWVEIFDQAKLILTQSRFCQEIFSRQITDPSKIHVISYILPQNCSPQWKKNRLEPDGVFVFGSIFEWIPRKAPERLIEAFLNEFDKDEPVKLILRTESDDIHNLDDYVSMKYQDPRIRIISTPIPDVIGFYRGLDAYISCTAGEGFGQTLAEAMACGIPTIASNHSGNLDFMNDSNSWLVEVEPWSPSEPFPEYLWRLPKVESIQQKMREVYSLWIQQKKSPKIKKALTIADEMNAAKIGLHLFDIISSFLES